MRIETFVTASVVSVVVVWLASDCLVALHCSLFRFCVCVSWSVAIHGGFTPFVRTAVSVPPLSLLPLSFRSKFLIGCRLRVKFTCIIESENFRMLSRGLLHFCSQRDTRPSFTNVTMTLFRCTSSSSSVKMFGSEICRDRGSRDSRDFDFAILCKLLYPHCWSGNVQNSPSSSGRVSSHFKHCLISLVFFFLLMSTPRSLSIETAPSPADVPFTRAYNSNSSELHELTPCVVLVELSMWEPQNSLDDVVLLRVFRQPA